MARAILCRSLLRRVAPSAVRKPSPQQNLSHPRFADGVAGLAVEEAPLLRIILRAASEHDCISGPYLKYLPALCLTAALLRRRASVLDCSMRQVLICWCDGAGFPFVPLLTGMQPPQVWTSTSLSGWSSVDKSELDQVVMRTDARASCVSDLAFKSFALRR